MTLSDALYAAADARPYYWLVAFLIAGGLLVFEDALWVVTHR